MAGSPALQATSAMAAGSIQNAFTKPVLLHSDRYQPVTFAVIHRSGHSLHRPRRVVHKYPMSFRFRRIGGPRAC